MKIPKKYKNIIKGWLYFYWYVGGLRVEYYEDRNSLEAVIDNHLTKNLGTPEMVVNLETGEIWRGEYEIDANF